MSSFDESQRRVLALRADRHARILGAPGTGKTTVLIESFARLRDQTGWRHGEIFVLAPNRLGSARLRGHVERRVGEVMGGTPVGTASSLAFSLLSRRAARLGLVEPRLLTGTVHDEVVAEVIAEAIAEDAGGVQAGDPRIEGLAPEVLLSAPFRAELRELSRVLDDFDLSPSEARLHLSELARETSENAFAEGPSAGLSARWDTGLTFLEAVQARLHQSRPGELSASAMLRLAAGEIRAGAAEAPRIILVEDAQELGEGALALLAACATAGSTVWVFGDPDIATGAFQGERTRVLAGLVPELARRGWIAPDGYNEEFVQLERVYRHGPQIRGFVQELTRRIGAAGVGVQREALSEVQNQPQGELRSEVQNEVQSEKPSNVQFVCVDSESQQLGVIAHRMRRRKLGPNNAMAWREMAVVCRSRAEAVKISRMLAAHQVPSSIAAGGLVLREHQVVRELIELLQHARGGSELSAEAVLRLAGGVIGGLDPVAVRRLRGALLIQERRAARKMDRESATIEELVMDGFTYPGDQPLIDSAGGRALRKLGMIAAAGARVHAAGGTPREVLWAIWDRTRLAARWQEQALSGRGVRADEANRGLDAVLGLFFALQRHEEQSSTVPVEELLADILSSSVPEDSLAQRSARDVVTVTTPQGMVGREFELVIVLGAQDGAWPNLKARGSLLGTSALERMLRGGLAEAPSRRDTVHDELRLFAQTCSRARSELLVVAVANDDNYPSPFYAFGRNYEVAELPQARLTLRGVTAAARRRLNQAALKTDSTVEAAAPDQSTQTDEAVHTLAVLAHAGVPGAHPDDWYGVMPQSTRAPLYGPIDPNESAPEPEKIPVSPSQLERVETCPLDWVIGSLGGGTGNLAASLGTLVHHALETVPGHDPEELLAAITSEWQKLQFDAAWESERMRRTAAAMAEGLSDYLREFAASDRELLGKESRFSIDIGRAELRGVADRIELRARGGRAEITVIDLKTGRTPATKNEAETHVQLQSYQLGVAQGAFDLRDSDGNPVSTPTDVHTAAKLLYVHPDATKKQSYVERVQPELSEEARNELLARVTVAAETMEAGEFTARIEHHCSDPHQPGNCRLHIIQAVSHS